MPHLELIYMLFYGAYISDCILNYKIMKKSIAKTRPSIIRTSLAFLLRLSKTSFGTIFSSIAFMRLIAWKKKASRNIIALLL